MICGYFVFASGKSTLAKEYSPCFDSYIPKTVIREGVYKYIRHPIYTGNLISFFGLFISNGSLWNLLNLFVLIYFYIDTTHQEEKALSNKFKDYSEYCKSTGKFFPKLKSLRQISIF
jgi:protein-S-isoprenylcysteine O-methyltransferase Ste14